MGKKGKKSFYKKLKQNKVLLAALAGAVTGITISNILGTEKAQQIISSVEDSVKNFGDKLKNGYSESSRLPEKRQPA